MSTCDTTVTVQDAPDALDDTIRNSRASRFEWRARRSSTANSLAGQWGPHAATGSNHPVVRRVVQPITRTALAAGRGRKRSPTSRGRPASPLLTTTDWRVVFRRRFLVVGALVVAAVLSGCSTGSDEPSSGDSYSVGVLVMAQAQIIDDVVNAFTETTQKGVGDGARVTFDVKNANGDQSLVASIAREFATSDRDAFAVIGTPAVIALAAQVTDRPIFALAMGDPVGAGVAQSLQRPGKNVTGSIDFIDPALLLDDLLALHPGLRTIGTLYDPSNQSMQVWTDALRAAAATAGIKVAESTISSTAEVAQAARSLDGRAEAVLVGPDALVAAGIDAVGAAMTGARLPLYVVGGDTKIAGIVGSLGPDYPQLGVSAGVNAAKVLLGADVASTPFATPGEVDIVLNKARAQELGITVPVALADRVVES